MLNYPPLPEDSIFVVVDIQERICKVMDMDRYQQKMINSTSIMQTLNIPTVVTQQYTKGLGSTICEIADQLPKKAEHFEKSTFSCWGSVDFAKWVTARPEKTLIMIGMETHVCVQQTALEAIERGYSVILLADAVCSRSEYDKEISIQLMRDSGVKVTTSESLSLSWLKDSKHPHFRTISKIIA